MSKSFIQFFASSVEYSGSLASSHILFLLLFSSYIFCSCIFALSSKRISHKSMVADVAIIFQLNHSFAILGISQE